MTRMVSMHVFCFLLFSFLVQLVSATKCPPLVPCGDVGNVSFPFTTTANPHCGILVIHGCEGEPGYKKSIQNDNKWFDVIKLDESTITIRDDDLLNLLLSRSRSCEALGYNSTFTLSSPFAFSQITYYQTMLRCNHTLHPRPHTMLSNSTVCGSDTFYEIAQAIEDLADLDPVLNSSSYNHLNGCSISQLPLSDQFSIFDPYELLNFVSPDIPIDIILYPNCSNCHDYYGGQCRLDHNGKFYCDKGKTRKTVQIVAAVTSVCGALGVLIVLTWCFRRRFCNKENPTHQIIETFLKNHGHLAAKRYSYLEIKKATNSFKDKLGQGGYGSVYKGKLHDGSLVAVKVLSDLKHNGEEFINEVASISVTSHVNIVSLLGFYLEGSKRALIYEYMPNGSVEKFIYKDKDPSKFRPELSCKTMYNVAIGVARGLEYLHKGCNTKIVHFDIKPHNILLDEDFCPKISDFGLAKICPKKESIVSLLGARGTAGYIAPEVFSRNFGEISHKSDVYSYGMMVLEMIGGRKNFNEVQVQVEDSSEIYFPHWVYKCLELNQEPELQCVKNEIDKELVRKMIIVSLWCIQADPSNRPAMRKVVDMMEGSLESLQIPPKPFLSSPSRPPWGSSNNHTHTSLASYTSKY